MTHVLTQTQLLFFSALAFVWLNKQGLYPPELHSVNLDMEWFYRKLIPSAAERTLGVVRMAKGFTLTALMRHVEDMRKEFNKSPLAIYHLSESWPTGSMVFWISAILGAFLLLNIFGMGH
jgi:multicomponent Na+:H+ antiporter subunit D